MNMQVRLLNSLVRLADQVNSELVGLIRITEQMIANSMQFSKFSSIHKVETPSKISYLLFIS